MRALWLVNQLWVIVTINPRKNRAFTELLYKSNRPQVSMVYKLINRLVYKFFWCSANIPRGLSAYKAQKLVVYCLIIYCQIKQVLLNDTGVSKGYINNNGDVFQARSD